MKAGDALLAIAGNVIDMKSLHLDATQDYALAAARDILMNGLSN